MSGLVAVFDALAADLADVTRMDLDGAVSYRHGQLEFAVADDAGGELRLLEPIAAAALRTPDVSASDRGAGWIRFRPRTLDRFALDRASAWFELAWRRAAPLA